MGACACVLYLVEQHVAQDAHDGFAHGHALVAEAHQQPVQVPLRDVEALREVARGERWQRTQLSGLYGVQKVRGPEGWIARGIDKRATCLGDEAPDELDRLLAHADGHVVEALGDGVREGGTGDERGIRLGEQRQGLDHTGTDRRLGLGKHHQDRCEQHIATRTTFCRERKEATY